MCQSLAGFSSPASFRSICPRHHRQVLFMTAGVTRSMNPTASLRHLSGHRTFSVDLNFTVSLWYCSQLSSQSCKFNTAQSETASSDPLSGWWTRLTFDPPSTPQIHYTWLSSSGNQADAVVGCKFSSTPSSSLCFPAALNTSVHFPVSWFACLIQHNYRLKQLQYLCLHHLRLKAPWQSWFCVSFSLTTQSFSQLLFFSNTSGHTPFFFPDLYAIWGPQIAFFLSSVTLWTYSSPPLSLSVMLTWLPRNCSINPTDAALAVYCM